MSRARIALARAVGLAAALALAGCGGPGEDHAAALLDIHARILEAHRARDAEAWTALEADTVIVGSRGETFTSTREERLAMRRDYLGATRFSVYRDIAPPIVRISRDGTQGWLLANVEVVAHRDGGAAPDSAHTIWAWIELYERRNGRWEVVGNVSNERPGR